MVEEQGSARRRKVSGAPSLEGGSTKLWRPERDPQATLFPATPLSDLARALSELTRESAVSDAVQIAIAHAEATERLQPLSRARFSSLWQHFAQFAKQSGVNILADVDELTVERFVRARTTSGGQPSDATMQLRRAAIRHLFKLFREHGARVGDPSIDLDLPKRSQLLIRPLTDEEVQRCEWASLHSFVATRHPAVWALAEAGATTSELPLVTRAHLDLENGVVRLAGGPKTFARVSSLTPWGVTQLRRRISDTGLAADRRITFRGGDSEASARTSCFQAIAEIFVRAGLGDDVAVRAESVRSWLGRRVMEDGGHIEDAARRLGLRSLDHAAAVIGFDWPPKG
jgi:site-specific recombinase XerC